jgi:hypothetical protein
MHGSFNDEIAVVAELADAQASGACGRKAVEVQVLSTALKNSKANRLYRPAVDRRLGDRVQSLIKAHSPHHRSIVQDIDSHCRHMRFLQFGYEATFAAHADFLADIRLQIDSWRRRHE